MITRMGVSGVEQETDKNVRIPLDFNQKLVDKFWKAKIFLIQR